MTNLEKESRKTVEVPEEPKFVKKFMKIIWTIIFGCISCLRVAKINGDYNEIERRLVRLVRYFGGEIFGIKGHFIDLRHSEF